MKKSSHIGMLVTLLTLLLLRTDARLLENDLFVGPGNPSAFDPQLNSVVGEAGMASIPSVEKKGGIPCDEGKASLTNHTNMLTFTFKEDGTKPSGTTPQGNVALTEERLAKSEHSPGVGHMQVFNKGHMQDGSKKRVLKSTPSPGGGH